MHIETKITGVAIDQSLGLLMKVSSRTLGPESESQ
jgi:hypothetical protein